MTAINVYTDGSCVPNPGPGGWAYLFIDDTSRTEVWFSRYGSNPATTNNRMEMRAIIQFLKDATTGERYIIHSDSMYALKGLIDGGKYGTVVTPGQYTGYMKRWKKEGWPSRVKNPEVWKELDRECTRHLKSGTELVFQWVKGHNGEEGNEFVDKLAKRGAKEAQRSKQSKRRC